MNKDYELISTKDGFILSKYIQNSPIVSIPNKINEIKVIAIGKYAFHNHREIHTISLPDSIQTIGSHAFYDCRNLTILRIGENIKDIEDGAFKNCNELSQIELRVRTGKLTPLKSILSELNQELSVTLLNGDGESEQIVAKLLFPSYLYHYVELTQARIINQETYGTGVHYRECVTDAMIDYKKYDGLFYRVKEVEELKTAISIAMNRVAYPYHLADAHFGIYMDFLTEHRKDTAALLMKNDDFEVFQKLMIAGLCDMEHIDSIIDLIYEHDKIEWVSYLMQYKRETFGVQEKTFEL